MPHTDKHIEVYQYSPSTWWVSYREYHHGKWWNHDVSHDLSESEAMASAHRRKAITGYPIYIVQELAQTRQNEVPAVALGGR